MKISVCIPVYDGKLQVQTVAALIGETTIATMLGHTLTVRFLPSCCNLAKGRNQLVKEFLATDDDRLVFVDGDISFEPGSIVKLAEHPAEFVGGCYRYKRDEEKYPIGWIAGDLWSDKHGLIEVAMLPTGFLALSRSVFEKFKDKHPNRSYVIEGHKTYCYFQIPYADGHLYTEDAYFCKEWREMGGKIFLDPSFTLTHWEFNKPYTGQIGNWLKSIQAKENV